MNKRKGKTLPKQIYVRWENESDEPYLGASETPDGIEDGVKVGVYQLCEVKTKKITEELI